MFSKTLAVAGTAEEIEFSPRVDAPLELSLGETALLRAGGVSSATSLKWETPDGDFPAAELFPGFENPFLTFLADELGDFPFALVATSSAGEEIRVSSSIRVPAPEISLRWTAISGELIVSGATEKIISGREVWLCEEGGECSAAAALQKARTDAGGGFSFSLGEVPEEGFEKKIFVVLPRESGGFFATSEMKEILARKKN